MGRACPEGGGEKGRAGGAGREGGGGWQKGGEERDGKGEIIVGVRDEKCREIR